MTLVLRLTARQQATQLSCWWACMRMVLAYYGQHVTLPEEYRVEFRRPFGYVSTPGSLPRYDANADMTQPFEWYYFGVPNDVRCLERLCNITGFRPLSRRPAFGHWTAQDVEDTLRRHGPFMFVGNWNRQGSHAVLVIGRKVSDPGTANQIDEVIYIDPAQGQALPVNIAHFNAMMASVGASQVNPLRFPTRRPIRATVADSSAPSAAAAG